MPILSSTAAMNCVVFVSVVSVSLWWWGGGVCGGGSVNLPLLLQTLLSLQSQERMFNSLVLLTIHHNRFAKQMSPLRTRSLLECCLLGQTATHSELLVSVLVLKAWLGPRSKPSFPNLTAPFAAGPVCFEEHAGVLPGPGDGFDAGTGVAVAGAAAAAPFSCSSWRKTAML